MNTPNNDGPELWAHRDQGVAAYLIATGTKLCMIADLDTERPLFVFDEPAGSRVMDRVVTEYKIHTLEAYRHRRPHEAHARAMACADQEIDLRIAKGRELGVNEIMSPEGMTWVWMPDAVDTALLTNRQGSTR